MKRLQSKQMLLQNHKSLKKAAAVAVACCTILGSLLVAQIRNRPRDDQEQTEQPAPKRRAGKTPRALGVLEITGGNARLIPVSILIDGKFYDASVYKADPQPMAVEPETVYEGQKTGDPVGLFTVTRTQEANGNWVGVGVWELKRPGDTSAPKQLKLSGPQSDRPRGMDDDEGPPKLRRPGSAADKNAPAATSPAPASTTSSTSTNTPQPSTPGAADKTTSADNTSADSKTSGRPTLVRHGESQPDNAPAQPAPASQAETKPQAQADTKTTAEASPSAVDEGGRPVLRRGNTGGEQADKIPAPKTAVAKGAAVGDKNSGKMHAPVGYTDTLAAISDSGGPTPRAFTMMLKPDERAGYEQKMNQYASEAIRRFAVTHPIRDRQAPNVALTDIQMHVFDVNSSNEPVLVLTARAPETAATPAAAKPAVRATRSRNLQAAPKQTAQPAPTSTVPHPSAESAASAQGSTTDFQYYITVVARVDVNGDVRKLFDSVTDTSHLDAIPRLQLIDCVDANGDGVGELLFRENYDRSRAFAIYRVGMDQLWQLFEGAQASFSAGQ